MELEIDVRDMPNGLYLLRLTTQAGVSMLKIILEK
jgi:hypothetical protein